MNWTKDSPIKDGFYWFRGEIKSYHEDWDKVKTIIIKIDTDFENEPRAYFAGTDSSARFSELNGEWQGPIIIPE